MGDRNELGGEMFRRAGNRVLAVHEINKRTVFSVDDLRAALAMLKPGDPVALQVERAGQWLYVAFEMP
jgi:S1-C subfamily serine protease